MFFCINYINKYQFYFSSSKAWVLWALINLHNYLSFFLINALLVVTIFMIHALWRNINIILYKNKKNFKIQISKILSVNNYEMLINRLIMGINTIVCLFNLKLKFSNSKEIFRKSYLKSKTR